MNLTAGKCQLFCFLNLEIPKTVFLHIQKVARASLKNPYAVNKVHVLSFPIGEQTKYSRVIG